MEDRRVVYSFDEFDELIPHNVHSTIVTIEELEPITVPQSTASFLD